MVIYKYKNKSNNEASRAAGAQCVTVKPTGCAVSIFCWENKKDIQTCVYFYSPELMFRTTKLIFMRLSVIGSGGYKATHKFFIPAIPRDRDLPGQKVLHVFRARIHRHYMKYLNSFLY